MADDKLTRKSQEAVTAALRQAATDGSPQVEPLHLLVTLIEQSDGTTAPLLRAVGADPGHIAKEAAAKLEKLPHARGATLSDPGLSRPVYAAIKTAADRARELGDEYISTEHLLVGLAADGGEAKNILTAAGATPDALLDAFTQIRGSARVTSEDPEGTYKALEKYDEDLVDQLFNSSEKRLARVLLLLAHFGKEGIPETVVPKISQETLADMVGTTRSRVSFFMNRFRKLGLIHYAGGTEGALQVHSSLLNIVLHD